MTERTLEETEMTERTLDSALKQYQTVINKITEVQARHVAELVQIEATRGKIRSWLVENAKDLDTPAWLFDADPVLNWHICKQTDDVAVSSHMKIDDEILVAIKQKYDQAKKELDETLESIENWGLQQMLARGSKGFKSDNGSAQLRNDVKYKIEDKALLAADAIKNGYASELTITLRPNSKFAQQFVENSGYLMPGVSSFREQRCVYVKS